jgi:hypothetical protein
MIKLSNNSRLTEQAAEVIEKLDPKEKKLMEDWLRHATIMLAQNSKSQRKFF